MQVFCRVFSFSILLSLFCTSCAFYPLDVRYAGPEPRPASINQYYDASSSYTSHESAVLDVTDDYTCNRIKLKSRLGEITIDYYQRPEKSDSLVLVFPVLGGRNIFSNHFAKHFARNGFDSAVVHRNSDFKKPENFDRLEEVFRNNIVQDRVALDFFEEVYGKRKFGSFGISRGAINAAMTAGVDPRLEHNVLALGGADLVNVFRDSSERGINKFRKKVMKMKNITENEFYETLTNTVKTDPKNLAPYIDAEKTLLILAVFDQSVPFKYGLKLRRLLGQPDTVFLFSGHYTALVYTQFVKLGPKDAGVPIFPLDYVETEAIAFYHRSFNTGEFTLKELPYKIYQVPFNILGRFFDTFF